MRVRNLVVISALALAAFGARDAGAGPMTGGLIVPPGTTLNKLDTGAGPVARTGIYVNIRGTDAVLKPLPIASGPIVGFVTFESDPGTKINLTGIAPGAFGSALCDATPAAGQTCSLPGNPMSFANTANGSTMTISLTADLVNTSTGGSTSGTILYATQFLGQSYQQVLATLSGGASIMTGYSAEFESTAGTVGLRGLSKVTSTLVTFPQPPELLGSRIGWPSSPFGGLGQSGSGNGTFAGLGGVGGGGQSFGAGRAAMGASRPPRIPPTRATP